ncbi:MAG TPA: polysaccharide biosynthesis tyrosine autokinase [Vicinamibacteria bacterium]|nr:polysaccharide biosynthesis tyrosine autokinase [Vicinamibacteria bacterium]
MSSLLPTGSGAQSDSTIDVQYYGGLLWKSAAFLATSAALGLGLGLLVAFAQTPEYRATVMVQIDPPTPTFLSVQDALAGGFWQNADFYNTQFKVLRSGALGEKTLVRLKLRDQPPFQGDLAAGGVFMRHVAVEPVPESRLVLLHVTHRYPTEAALWANTLADVYIEDTISSRIEAARKAYEWLQERLGATQKSMREAQDRLFKSYQTQDLFVPEGSTSAVTSSIGKLTADLIDAQARRIALEAALKQIEQLERAGQALGAVPQFASNPAIVRLNTEITQAGNELARLRQQFKEGHPDIQRLVLEVEQGQRAREREGKQIVARMHAEYQQLQRRESELRGAIDGEKAQAASQSRKAAELDALRKEAESAKSLYDVLLQKLNETDIAASIRNNNVTVVERATPPTVPIRPDKRKIATAGAFLGMLFGVGLVLARDYLDNTIKNPDEIERFLHVDLLAAVPQYDEESVHFVTEAYQNLRTALIFGRKEETGQVVLVTGTVPQEGKTTTLVNLGKLLASSGEKTVLVDFDLRRGQLSHRLNLTREPGITNFFVNHEDLDALIRPARIPNLFALTTGPLPPNPPAILTRQSMADLLERLRGHFSWILVDAPPLASVTDALLLARYADLTVFVVQHNKADKKLIRRHLTALRKATDTVLGVVLNAVDVRTKGYYYYYYPNVENSVPPPGKAEDVAAVGKR